MSAADKTKFLSAKYAKRRQKLNGEKMNKKAGLVNVSDATPTRCAVPKRQRAGALQDASRIFKEQGRCGSFGVRYRNCGTPFVFFVSISVFSG
jgi:hypothetical protein